MSRSGFLTLTLSLWLCRVSRDSLRVSALKEGNNSRGWSETILNAGDHEPPPPVNLSLISHNFKTILTWAYVNEAPEETNFTVEFMDYLTAQWQLFPSCSNIALHHCDVTKAFSLNLTPTNSYYTKIKAITQFQDSQFAFTKRFNFKQNATIGAPMVEVKVHGQQISLRCIYPVVPNLTMQDGQKIDHDFKCNICVWQKGHNELPKKNCRYRKSKLKLNIKQPRVTLCVSARVITEEWKIKADWSTPKCFQVQSLNLQETLVILLAVIAFFLGLVAASIIWKLLKKELVLPTSLMLIVKAIKPYVDMKTEDDAVSVVIKYEEVIPVECDHFFEEVAKPMTNPEITEPLTVDLKYAGKDWAYDRPQTLLDVN
ncbi:interferon gamma receptor 1-like isoform X1 [Carcharodon carcharias]|uniref:interferon gamma receptor 1-like isoform X1 n=2 Tax=Carcharodon carcharias TaxID=13397 RepID=UPI001B7EEA8F|nr:interferon gamma receptor 1-like isoform X1 [Carcharodon carcharias]